MAKGPRKPSRTQLREQLLANAAATVLPDAVDVCVCGGGAAGLVAAICAAEAGASTVVLERDLACGRPILATGNGRCNLTSFDVRPGAYNDPAFAEGVLGPGGLAADDVLGFFDACGLSTAFENEDDMRVYPTSDQASSVRDVLLARAERAGVTMACAREVTGIDGGTVSFTELFSGRTRRLEAASIVLACRDGYVPEGIEAKPFSPALCPLACEGLPFEHLDGRRSDARVTLLRDGRAVAQERGEVLFRSYGLSGIVIFNFSRIAIPGDTLALDLAPLVDEQRFSELVGAAGSARGVIDPAIVEVLGDVKRVSCTVVGKAQTEHAQVRQGGLLTAQFDPETLMAREHPGLFAAGEVLDIDGPCGGYNLTWAWKSGMVAGAAAAAFAKARA
ncbi:MAG: NAD(P)/FAD-dependent oxidoreductase [Coriobacteriaceae bacterium]|nr:NAD(P)/FAD-dependent oxidoreductase [Coriobacteriaceae bacterium]